MYKVFREGLRKGIDRAIIATTVIFMVCVMNHFAPQLFWNFS